MKFTFEYKVIPLCADTVLQDTLNEYGAQGWFLCRVISTSMVLSRSVVAPDKDSKRKG